MRKSRFYATFAQAQARPALYKALHEHEQQNIGILMEAERINQIEATLADLSARTEDLRRYL